jgi:DNA primase
VIVVEGYMDVVGARAARRRERRWPTLGTATTPFHVSKLLKLADNVVFCFDGDAAGRRRRGARSRSRCRCSRTARLVSFLFLPPEDDPDTYVRRLGKEAFVKELAHAKPLSQFLFAELASHVDMGTDEGRARFLAQAEALVAQIEAPALAAMLRRRLGEMARLAPEEIDRLLPAKSTDSRPRSAPPPAARFARGRPARRAACWPWSCSSPTLHPRCRLKCSLGKPGGFRDACRRRFRAKPAGGESGAS